MNRSLFAAPLLFALISFSHGQLELKLTDSTQTADKALVSFELTNTGTQSLTGARAWVFLMNDEGKVVGNKAMWVIGEPSADPKQPRPQPALPAGERGEYAVALDIQKPFTKAKITFSRLILEDGSLPDPRKGVQDVTPKED